MVTPESIWSFAGTTAAVGMGVVFVALFLLSAYMHGFKALIGRLEGREEHKPAPPRAPRGPVVTQLAPRGGDAAARLAAAVAVGLHLHGAGGRVAPEVVAAIASALALHRRAGEPAPEAAPGTSWRLAGRLSAMGARSSQAQRPVRR
ncbi:MAG: OadG family protein [Deferrisomatales bacterium]